MVPGLAASPFTRPFDRQLRRNIPMRVLVSHEDDDRVGVDLLGRVDGLEVVTYDPSGSLSPEQCDAAILIPPYHSSHRPIPLLKELRGLRMVQLLSAGPTSGLLTCRLTSSWPPPAGHMPDPFPSGCCQRSCASTVSGRRS
ncbi:putative D-isomer specific 2-hydroxyacid dehydrogenase domain protein [Mycobacterium kansasii]|uniref:Putative D-isomer specific 2-hydroxyacid dehydrogenase domain protein n=1 Tax=Mycobacterium kansasii TaxID=1768 RepID=A0A1V3WQ72_MYCKA|nr:putative D-isomer specific 2-hydroxyacid dehydrogenase domain protein [Mycobacterium kansasii]